MITALVRFRLPPGATLADARAGVEHTIPIYQTAPGLKRKQIHLDPERGEGRSVYLFADRASAEAFFARARAMLVEQTGAEPEIELLDTHFVVDNDQGEVWRA